jgi:uncharacterized protein YjdB
MTLAPFVTPFNADRTTLRWSSSNEAVATVSESGVVTGVTAGTANITLTDGSGNIRAESSVTVRADTRPTTGISVSRRTLSLNVGAESTLTVTYRPTNATIRGVTWTSSDESVARVDPNGKVTAVAGGTAIITATSDSGARTATCTVTVRVPVTTVSLAESAITLRIGETYQLVPIITPENATNVAATYSSRATSIATVSSSGLITARRAGTTTVTVRVDGRTTTVTVTVTR